MERPYQNLLTHQRRKMLCLLQEMMQPYLFHNQMFWVLSEYSCRDCFWQRRAPPERFGVQSIRKNIDGEFPMCSNGSTELSNAR